MTTAGDQERIAKLRELIEAEGGSAPAAAASASAQTPRRGDGPPVNRQPMLIAIGAGVAIAVMVALLLSVSGGGGVKKPDGTTERAVAVFPTRIVGRIDKGDKVTICDRNEGILAQDVTVADYGTEESQFFGRIIRLDLYVPNEDVGRFANKPPANLDVVRGSCGPVPTTTTTTALLATQPPATQPADSTQPTQPPDSTQPATPPPSG